MHAKFLISFLSLSPALLGIQILKNWNDLPLGGITQDMRGNFNYDASNPNGFVLSSNILFINTSASLAVRTIISGDWKNRGAIFEADPKGINQGKFTFSQGNISFYVQSENAKNLTYFHLPTNSSLDINANLTLSASNMSDFSQGLFHVDGGHLNLVDANFFLDLSNNIKTPLLFLVKNGSVKINNGGNKAAQTLILKGGISMSGGEFSLDLANPSSYFQGGVTLLGNSSFALNLDNSSATLSTYTQNNGSQAKFSLIHSTLNATLIGNNTSLDLSQNSQWNIWGNQNNINTLTLSHSNINFMQNQEGNRFGEDFIQKTLQAQNLEGEGIFSIYGDLANKGIDTLTLSRAQGNFGFDILYNPSTFSQALAEGISSQDRLVVASINDLNTQANFYALPTTMGLTSYQTHLQKITQNNALQWVISQITPDGESPLTRALTTALNAPHRLFELSDQTLAFRLGDLRDYPKDHGLFFHYTIAQNSFAPSSILSGGKDLFMKMEGGYHINALYKGHNDFLGLGFEINLMQTKASLLSSQSQSYGGFLSYTSVWGNRFYYDLLLKYAYSPTQVDFKSIASKSSLSAHLLTLSTEVGKKFAFLSSQSFPYIEPQAKLTTGLISSSLLRTTDPKGIPIEGKLSFEFPLLIKSGLYLGYEWNEKLCGDLKAGVFIDYTLFNGGETLLKDQWSSFKKKFPMDFDVGFSILSSIALKDMLRFYFQIQSSFLGSYTQDILFNAGISWSFGDRYIPPPPPPADPKRFKIRRNYSKSVRDIPTIKKNDRSNMKHHEGDPQQIRRDYERRRSNIPLDSPQRRR